MYTLPRIKGKTRNVSEYAIGAFSGRKTLSSRTGYSVSGDNFPPTYRENLILLLRFFRNSTRTHSKVKSSSLTKEKVVGTRACVPPCQDTIAYLSIPLSSSQSFTSSSEHFPTDPTGALCVATPSDHNSSDLP